MLNKRDNFLDTAVLDAIVKKYEESQGKAVFEVNTQGRWTQGLSWGNYASVLILPLPEYEDYFFNLYATTVDPVFANCNRNRFTAYLHIWPPGTQIGWHEDAPETERRIASTIYINPYWNWNWGGLFLYDDRELGQGWIFPERNRMVWFEAPVWHATSMVTPAAEFPRLSIQLFFHKNS